MKIWIRLSPLTRWTAVMVLLSSLSVVYVKQRWAPLREAVQKQEQSISELRRENQGLARRVEELGSPQGGQPWSHPASYAQVLAQQTTGRSVRDILSSCGSGEELDLNVRDLRFERMQPQGGFQRISASLAVEGRYHALLDLLHELDRAFPPVEVVGVALSAPETRSARSAEVLISAQVEAIIHEPR